MICGHFNTVLNYKFIDNIKKLTWGIGQHAHVSSGLEQQVVLAGHSYNGSGHTTPE